MTFEEFEKLPDEVCRRCELRRGQLVEVAPPVLEYHLFQDRLAELLEQICGDSRYVLRKFGFRGLPQYEYRYAGVGCVFRERLQRADLHSYFSGMPDLVIEVLSPSNTMPEILDKEQLCLENGTLEFWTVDLETRQVRVSMPNGITTTYHAGQRIPLRLFGDATLAVDAIFEPSRHKRYNANGNAMGATTTHLMSFEEFARLPEPVSCRYELRHGELVQVPPPKQKRRRIQDRLVELLRPMAGDGYINIEVAFRALPEGEFRTADIAYVPRSRWEEVADDDNLRGAPDLVIEVLSPSNTASEMAERRKLCLENGCREFWIVDADLRQIDVSTPDGITTTYHSGQRIPLHLFSADLLLDEIFETR